MRAINISAKELLHPYIRIAGMLASPRLVVDRDRLITGRHGCRDRWAVIAGKRAVGPPLEIQEPVQTGF